MAVQVHGGRFRNKRFAPMSDINVTPFVDVMLVLLVVFMIAAPLLSVGVVVDLPEAAAPTLQGLDEPLTVSIDEQGRIHVQEKQTELTDLAATLTAITAGNRGQRIFVRGDRAINYGRVMATMGVINSAGFNRVALVAQAPEESGR